MARVQRAQVGLLFTAFEPGLAVAWLKTPCAVGYETMRVVSKLSCSVWADAYVPAANRMTAVNILEKWFMRESVRLKKMVGIQLGIVGKVSRAD